jgi:hypothetical protein
MFYQDFWTHIQQVMTTVNEFLNSVWAARKIF